MRIPTLNLRGALKRRKSLNSLIKADPISNDMIQNLTHDVTTEQGFEVWVEAFLERIDDLFGEYGCAKAEEIYSDFRRKVNKLVKVVAKVGSFVNRGDLSYTKQTVKARNTLNEIMDACYTLTLVVENDISPPSGDEKIRGYNKYHMASVFVRTSFREYKKMVLCRDIVWKLRDSVLNAVANTMILDHLNRYERTVGRLQTILTEVGIEKVEEKVRQLHLASEPPKELLAEFPTFFKERAKEDFATIPPGGISGSSDVTTTTIATPSTPKRSRGKRIADSPFKKAEENDNKNNKDGSNHSDPKNKQAKKVLSRTTSKRSLFQKKKGLLVTKSTSSHEKNNTTISPSPSSGGSNQSSDSIGDKREVTGPATVTATTKIISPTSANSQHESDGTTVEPAAGTTISTTTSSDEISTVKKSERRGSFSKSAASRFFASKLKQNQQGQQYNQQEREQEGQQRVDSSDDDEDCYIEDSYDTEISLNDQSEELIESDTGHKSYDEVLERSKMMKNTTIKKERRKSKSQSLHSPKSSASSLSPKSSSSPTSASSSSPKSPSSSFVAGEGTDTTIVPLSPIKKSVSSHSGAKKKSRKKIGALLKIYDKPTNGEGTTSGGTTRTVSSSGSGSITKSSSTSSSRRRPRAIKVGGGDEVASVSKSIRSSKTSPTDESSQGDDDTVSFHDDPYLSGDSLHDSSHHTTATTTSTSTSTSERTTSSDVVEEDPNGQNQLQTSSINPTPTTKTTMATTAAASPTAIKTAATTMTTTMKKKKLSFGFGMTDPTKEIKGLVKYVPKQPRKLKNNGWTSMIGDNDNKDIIKNENVDDDDDDDNRSVVSISSKDKAKRKSVRAKKAKKVIAKTASIKLKEKADDKKKQQQQQPLNTTSTPKVQNDGHTIVGEKLSTKQQTDVGMIETTATPTTTTTIRNLIPETIEEEDGDREDNGDDNEGLTKSPKQGDGEKKKKKTTSAGSRRLARAKSNDAVTLDSILSNRRKHDAANATPDDDEGSKLTTKSEPIPSHGLGTTTTTTTSTIRGKKKGLTGGRALSRGKTKSSSSAASVTSAKSASPMSGPVISRVVPQRIRSSTDPRSRRVRRPPPAASKSASGLDDYRKAVAASATNKSSPSSSASSSSSSSPLKSATSSPSSLSKKKEIIPDPPPPMSPFTEKRSVGGTTGTSSPGSLGLLKSPTSGSNGIKSVRKSPKTSRSTILNRQQQKPDGSMSSGGGNNNSNSNNSTGSGVKTNNNNNNHPSRPSTMRSSAASGSTTTSNNNRPSMDPPNIRTMKNLQTRDPRKEPSSGRHLLPKKPPPRTAKLLPSLLSDCFDDEDDDEDSAAALARTGLSFWSLSTNNSIIGNKAYATTPAKTANSGTTTTTNHGWDSAIATNIQRPHNNGVNTSPKSSGDEAVTKHENNDVDEGTMLLNDVNVTSPSHNNNNYYNGNDNNKKGKIETLLLVREESAPLVFEDGKNTGLFNLKRTGSEASISSMKFKPVSKWSTPQIKTKNKNTIQQKNLLVNKATVSNDNQNSFAGSDGDAVGAIGAVVDDDELSHPMKKSKDNKVRTVVSAKKGPKTSSIGIKPKPGRIMKPQKYHVADDSSVVKVKIYDKNESSKE